MATLDDSVAGDSLLGDSVAGDHCLATFGDSVAGDHCLATFGDSVANDALFKLYYSNYTKILTGDSLAALGESPANALS